MKASRLAVCLGALYTIGCGGTVDNQVRDSGRDVAAPDMGAVDTGVLLVDAGPADTGVVTTDLGVADSGPMDTGTDAGPAIVDSGPMDTGVIAMDTGPTDTGPADTGPADTGPADTGPADAGPPDAGPPDTGPSCVAPQALCDGQCVNTQTSTAHCGVCNRACTSAPTNATPSCMAGACDFSCNAGFARTGSNCTPIATPRALSPASGGALSTLRPTFRWLLPSGVDGAEVEVCRDRGCSEVVDTFEGSGESVVASRDLPPRVPLYWRLRGRVGSQSGTSPSPVWPMTLRARSNSETGAAGYDLQDINGDGYSDLVVGAFQSSSVYVYFGSATGIGQSPNVIQGRSGTQFGASVALGDLNRDGFSDLAVGAPEEGSGVVYVYNGSSSGLNNTPRMLTAPAGVSRFGTDLSIGDVNGDGIQELFASSAGSVSVYEGRTQGPGPTPARVITAAQVSLPSTFGNRVAIVGDVQGDGYLDLAVNANQGVNGLVVTGAVVVFSGGPSGLSTMPIIQWSRSSTSSAESRFGCSVAGGDLNGDGFSDVVVGASRDVGLDVSVYPGSASGLAPGNATVTLSLDRAAGEQTATVTDFNGDGIADVVAASVRGGRSYLFLGRRAPMNPVLAATFDAIDASAVRFGAYSLGDLNGDGLGEAGIGVSFENVLHVHHGGRSNFASAPDVRLVGPAGANRFGHSAH